jgi:hypothetical protein
VKWEVKTEYLAEEPKQWITGAMSAFLKAFRRNGTSVTVPHSTALVDHAIEGPCVGVSVMITPDAVARFIHAISARPPYLKISDLRLAATQHPFFGLWSAFLK